MYCDNCGSEIDDGARFCEHCGHAIAVPAPSAGKVAAVHGGDTPDAIEGSGKGRTWVAGVAGLVMVLFSVGLIVLLLDSSSSTKAPTGEPLPEQTRLPTETDVSRRSFEAPKPSVPTLRLPLVDPDLYSAVWRGRTAEVRALVAGGANVNVRDSDNDPLLHEAIWRGHTDVVRILVDFGADVDAKESNGDPVLYEAIFRGHTEIVRILVNAGVDVNANDSRGRSPLEAARFWAGDNSEIVRMLLRARSPAGEVSTDGRRM